MSFTAEQIINACNGLSRAAGGLNVVDMKTLISGSTRAELEVNLRVKYAHLLASTAAAAAAVPAKAPVGKKILISSVPAPPILKSAAVPHKDYLHEHELYMLAAASAKDGTVLKRMYDMVQSYTGFNSTWSNYQQLLRHYDVRSYIHAAHEYGKDIFKLRDQLNKFISSAPSLPEMTVYRGMMSSYDIDSDKIIDWGFSGASLSKSVAVGFTMDNCCLYEISFPAKAPVLYIGHVSKLEEEQEVLLPAGAEYTVINVSDELIDGNMITVYKLSFTGIIHPVEDNPMYKEKPQLTSGAKMVIIGPLYMILNAYISGKRNPGAVDKTRSRLADAILDASNKYMKIVTPVEILEYLDENVTRLNAMANPKKSDYKHYSQYTDAYLEIRPDPKAFK